MPSQFLYLTDADRNTVNREIKRSVKNRVEALREAEVNHFRAEREFALGLSDQDPGDFVIPEEFKKFVSAKVILDAEPEPEVIP